MVEEYIEAGEYSEALNLLQDIDDERTRYLRLVCLFGLKELKRAKEEGKVAKAIAGDTYYDVVSIYLSVLKELEEYEEAIDIVVEELSMPYIPYQYEALFNAAYDELLLAKQEANALIETKTTIFKEEEIERVLTNFTNEDLLYMAIDQMQSMNIRALLYCIRPFLLSPDAPSLAKSLIIEILIDQQVDEELEIWKHDQRYEINPSYLSRTDESEAYSEIGDQLMNHLESDNPSLLLVCLEFLNYFMYDQFPRFIDEEEFALIAAAIHYYLATLQYIELDLEELSYSYGVESQEILDKIQILKQITI
ncbi:MAG: DUF3196 family protein [Beduini sp.]|uniref:DUF3196 family protein n=1 Tax=Beduini sp. TaxID=1922300 RepID=UPI00399FD709